MKLLRSILITAVLLATSIAREVRADTSLEYKVKAVVLFNFAKYVRWPEKTFESPVQPVQVCLVGENPFGDIFQSGEAPKEAQGRPLKVVELPGSLKAEDISKCQLLYWTEKFDQAIAPLHDALAQNAVLTISDRKSDEGLISFVIENEKVRFRIRHKAAQALGLEISSQLLKLAILDE